MITYKKFIKQAAQVEGNILKNLIKKYKVSLDDEINIKTWGKIYRNTEYKKSILDLKKQVKILRELPQDMIRYKIEKNRMISEIKGKFSEKEKEEPAWWALSTTDSKRGMRLVMGFRNGGCEYWTKTKDYIGCKNCFYGANCELSLKVTEEQILKQINNVLKNVKEDDFDVVELLNDGSFLNDNEFTPKIRQVIFEKLANLKNVKRIAIETRSEYVQTDKILKLLDILRSDQNLEIGIGLETIDPFVRDFCINKGFGTKQVEKKLKLVEKINKEAHNRVEVFFYCLVKPAYINEKEAIKDALVFVKYANNLLKKYNVSIKVNLEPVVVSKGTILDILYNDLDVNKKRRYSPLNYWSILEIVCLIKKEKIGLPVKIGSREDMDEFRSLPAIYNKFGMLSQYDFIVYWAIQQYNKDRDIVKLLSAVDFAFKDPALEKWKEDIDIKKPCFLDTYKENLKEIKNYKKTNKFKEESKIIKKIFKALDEIEYGETSQLKAQIWAYSLFNKKKVKQEITDYVLSVFKKFIPIPKLTVRFIELIEYKIELLRMQILFKYKGKEYGMWAAIPTRTKVNLKDIKS